jgi:hypothetical protein
LHLLLNLESQKAYRERASERERATEDEWFEPVPDSKSLSVREIGKEREREREREKIRCYRLGHQPEMRIADRMPPAPNQQPAKLDTERPTASATERCIRNPAEAPS